MTSGASVATRPAAPAMTRVRRFIGRWLLPFYVLLAVLYLALPVIVMIAFSFNDPAGRANLTWQGFSIDAWLNPLGPAGLGDAVLASLVIAFVSTIVATAIGVLMALASPTIPERLRTSGFALITTGTATTRFISSVAFGAIWVAWGAQAAMLIFLIGLAVMVPAAALALRRHPEAAPA